MRKLLAILVTTLFLGGFALAQSEAQAELVENELLSTQWFGVSTGYPIGIVLHYGINDLLSEDLDMRFNLSAVSFLAGSGFSIQGGADVLYHFDALSEIDVYAGGGLLVGISIGDNPGLALGVRGLGGAELFIADQLGLFGELQVGIGTNPVFRPGLVVGLNYHF